MTSIYSILQLLAVVFNPAFIGNYAVTVMAFMIAFSKFRMALQWLPIALLFIFMGDKSYRTFEKLVEEHNMTDAHTLAVKYNFHHGYIKMMTSYMSKSFDNFWIYDYAHIINRLIPLVQVIAVVYMAVYIIQTSPYNQWLLKRRRWDRFINNYWRTQNNRESLIVHMLTLFYPIVFKHAAYVTSCDFDQCIMNILSPYNLLYGLLNLMAAFLVSISIIRYSREKAIERHLSE
jgi:hypothetical protein